MHRFKQQVHCFLALGALLAGSTHAFGQGGLPSARVAVEPEQQVRLDGSTSPRAALAFDVGRASGNEILSGLTLFFKQTALQAESLKRLLAEQQTIGSANYHRWLSSKEYGEQFGLNGESIEAVTGWLLAQGLTHPIVNASHTAVSFDGNLALVEQVFSTHYSYYSTGGQTVLANAVDLQIPSSVGRFVDGVMHASQFRPPPQASLVRTVSAPKWTSASNGRHFLTPGDLANIYDFAPLLAAGHTGKGQQIAVVGQSAIDPGDIARFRAASGLNPRPPQLVLVPNTGRAIRKPGDEVESDIDLEYVSAAAPDADIILVYTGSDLGHNVFDALTYAVDQNLAPVISVSYGQCEGMLAKSEIVSLEKTLMQASAQGQTVIVSSGDLGATACEAGASLPAAHGLAVQYPASSAYVTSVGGTMFADSTSSDFWEIVNSSAGESAQSYIAEQAWSESRDAGQSLLFASGGGPSSLFSKPSWQRASGVPSDRARDIPDIALAAGVEHDGYIFCSSDSSLSIQGSCAHSFLDAASSNLTVAGGTSFSAPVAAGIAALLDQMSSTGRLGNLNPLLYELVTKQPSGFHDITSGTNRQPCSAGSKNCDGDGREGYSAGLGYDLVTGLGTLDVGQLAAVLTNPVEGTSYKLSLSLQQFDTPAYVGTVTHLMATLTGAAPSIDGEVVFSLDGVASGAPVSLVNGQAEYKLSAKTPGSHDLSAVFTSSSGLTATAHLQLVINGQASSPGTAFTLSSTTSSSPDRDQAFSVLTVFPSGTYSGEVAFTASTSDADLAAFGCYSLSATNVGTGTAAHATLLTARSPAACSSLAARPGTEMRKFVLSNLSSAHLRASAVLAGSPASKSQSRLRARLEAVEACCVLLLTGVRKRFRFYSASLIALVSIMTSLTGCSVTTTPRQADAVTSTVIVTAYDMLHPSMSASVSVPLVFN